MLFFKFASTEIGSCDRFDLIFAPLSIWGSRFRVFVNFVVRDPSSSLWCRFCLRTNCIFNCGMYREGELLVVVVIGLRAVNLYARFITATTNDLVSVDLICFLFLLRSRGKNRSDGLAETLDKKRMQVFTTSTANLGIPCENQSMKKASSHKTRVQKGKGSYEMEMMRNHCDKRKKK